MHYLLMLLLNLRQQILVFFAIFLFCQISFSQENKPQLNEPPNSQYDSDNGPFFKQLDTLFFNNDFEEFAVVLKKLSSNCDSCGMTFLTFLSEWTDTLIVLTKNEIDSLSFTIAIDNIVLIDDLNFNLVDQGFDWRSRDMEISELKCKLNTTLSKSFSSDIQKAYSHYKSRTQLNKAGELVANVQYYRLKFFRNQCFDRNWYDNEIKKIVEISTWIEKATIDAKYQKIIDNQPEWVKMGLSYEEYQEWWAQKLTAGSSYMGGGCNSCGKSLYKGKRGGIYYLNSSGNKQYIPK